VLQVNLSIVKEIHLKGRTMKRLLLSTTFILGTLTGLNASGEESHTITEQAKPRSPTGGSQRVDPVVPVDLISTLSADIAAVSRDVATLRTALIPAIPTPSTTPLDTFFATAFTALNSIQKEQALNEITARIVTVYPSTTKDALHSIEVSINSVIDNILSYEPTTFWTPHVCAMLSMCIAADLYLVTLFSFGVDKDSNWRVGITVPMGGASTFGICLAALTKFFTWWKESEHSNTFLKIQKTWGKTFSNPQEKAFLVKVLSHYWISKRLDGAAKGIQKALKNTFSHAKNMTDLHNELQKLKSIY
jgi:hypothetical protein